MRIVIHHTQQHEWHPPPPGTVVTPDDVKAGKAKPDHRGDGFLVRVTLPRDGGWSLIFINEAEIVARIIKAYCENGRQGEILTRREAVARVMRETIVPIHTHPKWMHDIQVEDDGPSEALFRAEIAPHLAADHGYAPGKNIEAEDVDEMVAAYLEPCDAHGHTAHLKGHFKIKPRKPAGKAAP